MRSPSPTAVRHALARAMAPCVVVALAVAVVLGQGSSASSSPVDDSQPVRILAYGDSITSGSGGDHTWRYFLDRHLTGVGQPFELVGPLRSVHELAGRPWKHQYADPEFDQDHAGYWGGSLHWAAASGAEDPGAETLVRDHRPDVVVVAAGSNDVGFFKIAPELTAERLRTWVEDARSVNPELGVVVVESTIADDEVYVRYNALLPDLVDDINLPAAPAALARAAHGFVPSTALDQSGDTWDAKHPNSAGAQKIAAAVADALATLGVGEQYPRPMPRALEGPVEPATLTVTGSGLSAELMWTVPDGATEVRLERLLVSGDDPAVGAWVAQGSDVSTLVARSTTVTGFPSCGVQRFRARALKQWTLADVTRASAVVEWAPTPIEPPAPHFFHDRGTTQISWRPVPGACTYRVISTHTAADGVVSTQETEVATHTVYFPTPSPGHSLQVEVVPRGSMKAGPSGRVSIDGPSWPSFPTLQPTAQPTAQSTSGPTSGPLPTDAPTGAPAQPSPVPSSAVPGPSSRPSSVPPSVPWTAGPVRGVRVVQRARTSVAVRWKPRASARAYRVQVKRAGRPWRTVGVVHQTRGGTVTSRVRTLRAGTGYMMRVRAVRQGAAGPWSRVQAFRTRR